MHFKRILPHHTGGCGTSLGASEKSMLGSFTHIFFRALWHLRGLYLALLSLIMAGAAVFAGVEKTPIGDTVYFAFITGLTVGYGDIVPTTTVGRIISVFLAFVGILFTGLVIAGAVHALREAWEKT